MNAREIAGLPVGELGLSAEFRVRCELMGFRCLGDVFALGPEELVTLPDFSYGWLGELVSFLLKYQALHLLQARAGKSPG